MGFLRSVDLQSGLGQQMVEPEYPYIEASDQVKRRIDEYLVKGYTAAQVLDQFDKIVDQVAGQMGIPKLKMDGIRRSIREPLARTVGTQYLQSGTPEGVRLAQKAGLVDPYEAARSEISLRALQAIQRGIRDVRSIRAALPILDVCPQADRDFRPITLPGQPTAFPTGKMYVIGSGGGCIGPIDANTIDQIIKAAFKGKTVRVSSSGRLEEIPAEALLAQASPIERLGPPVSRKTIEHYRGAKQQEFSRRYLPLLQANLAEVKRRVKILFGRGIDPAQVNEDEFLEANPDLKSPFPGRGPWVKRAGGVAGWLAEAWQEYQQEKARSKYRI